MSALALLVAAWIVPNVDIPSFWGALITALLVAVVNAIVPPIVAALRLPLILVLGFLIVLVVDAWALLIASDLDDRAIQVDSFWWALLTSLVASGVSVVLEVIAGTNDDDAYSLKVTRRIARRQGLIDETDVPGIICLEIDGLGLPVLQRAMRDGNAPNMARWLREGSHRMVEWETDLSSQTGASQAGILLGSNEDIPAFRWVEKETGTVMTCSAPPDCAELERRHATGVGPARERRRQPRQPAVGRGGGDDPHRQPHGGGEGARTPAIARSSRTATTSRARSCSSSGRSCSSGRRRCGPSAATCTRAAIAAASTPSCAARCA